MTNNPAPTADTEATVRRGIIAAVLLAALFLLPVIVLPVIALQSDDFNPLVLLVLALPLMPGLWALTAAYYLIRRQPHWQTRNTRVVNRIVGLLAAGAGTTLVTGNWRGALALAAATVALGLANETIGEAGAALAATQTRHP
ncbi:hypothetical protein AB0I30_16850 [Nocardia tengchongensis]|uniref:hypothetical protein n=1 Tax=Nocardia tengchongensis TaxID=2055889 RepID=UPI00340556D1